MNMDIPRPRINVRECPTIKCEKCESIYFREVLYLKFVSKLQGAEEDTTVPFPVYKCDSCGHVNKGFNPFETETATLINE
jgi:uncharacterized Zn finger protein